ncbi:electron transfer flavoprotein subunit beta/FixA family protein [Geothrix sp. 21YS21S-4]|uniref:electron transfer flavoprotein subunit beta/FixA family protein n=1 Tax=Geothrix sp. 21YS21S-4 TaxID=3068889 RepID=UPI0027B9729E|nr:electron transfer flavoprotein subunit beta/FixA family protein [Geothrix sp. 21YS21S-4]
MEILVCVKRVPDPAENEIGVAAGGADIGREDLVYAVNEWDNYAVEEALQIVEREGGSVTVVSLGDADIEEAVRREMAMGAEKGLMVVDDRFTGADGLGVASVLKAVAEKDSYDLILTGAQADDGAAQVGGMLAALLDRPFASLVNRIEVKGETLRIGREIEGGCQEVSDIDTPCVLSVQTGINEPRYVGIRGIRKVASVEIPCLDAAALAIEPAAPKVRRVDYFVPAAGAGADMLTGSTKDVAAQLVDLLKLKGGLN